MGVVARGAHRRVAGDMSTAQSALAEAGTQRGATTMAALERRAGAWAAPDTSHTVDRLLVDVRELIDAGDSGAAALCLDDVAFLRRPGIALDLPGAISDSEEPMAGLRRAHVSATSAGDHQLLTELASRFASLGGDRLAVECSAAAAVCAARAGDGRAARRAAGDTLRRAASCPDLASPGLIAVHALSSAAFMPLTPRSTTSLATCRRRHRDREIAEDLGIAERTVENHLARRYDKLHVHTC